MPDTKQKTPLEKFDANYPGVAQALVDRAVHMTVDVDIISIVSITVGTVIGMRVVSMAAGLLKKLVKP